MTFEEWWQWYSGGVYDAAERAIARSAWMAALRNTKPA